MTKDSAPSRFICCFDCGEPMNAVLSTSVRRTCHECGGSALRDSAEVLSIRREKAPERQAKRVEQMKQARKARREEYCE